MWRNIDEEEQAAKTSCVFCNIVAGDLPSRTVYEDDDIIAFHDATPVAKVHVLVIPKLHTVGLAEDERLLGRLLKVAATVADQMGVVDSGYRIAINQGADAGQIVDHLHVHVMGGQNLYPLGVTATGTEG